MRRRFFFWLDDDKDDEQSIIEMVKNLKHNRQFTATIRDGIRLVNDLRQGKTDVLLELFPWVLEGQKTLVPYEIIDFREQVNRMEQLLQHQHTVTSPVQVTRTERSLLQAQSEDDLLADLEITKAKSDENATYNMILSSLGMGIIKIEDLHAEVIEYAIKKGRLPESARKSISPKAAKPAGPKAMDVPDFAPPTIALDLELELNSASG